jgi:hypothetical protein
VNVNQDELVRSLLVERFSKWGPGPPNNDRAEMVAYPTVRDGLPFEPITRSVRARKYRPNANASRRSS